MTVSEMDHSKFDPKDSDNHPFLNYIMSVPPPKGLKPLTRIEGYDDTMDSKCIWICFAHPCRPISLVDVNFQNAFDKLGLTNLTSILLLKSSLDFMGEKVHPDGYTTHL